MKKGYIMIFLVIWVIIIFAILTFIVGRLIPSINKKEEKIISKEENIIENNIDIVTTFSNEKNETTEYVIKEKDGYIAIYILDQDENEILKETTEIVVKYLPEIDKEKLKKGIKVNNRKELNKVIEDYE